ncbi:lipopolysaccharide biosynthesis protein [Streptomyces gilvus]|uniref:lipopolysaccharide biosynthesis protein n=1 Tax=Streptomyces gilvus TaxID=2920937 RepID=UPI001F109A70|nr:polysaccharide biosynthesis C-terminal domain-containing protein [Streptomyces sp. CME 23]MCH5671515.1 polysaccharide biosynthesis C-terminal domain-containing protein [Streptomyces sp. CME 23]
MLGARAVSLVLGALASVVVARSLAPDARGTYYMAVTVASAAMALGHLSVEQAQTALWPDLPVRASLQANSLPLGLLIGTGAGTLAVVAVGLLRGAANLPDLWLLTTACLGVPLGVGVLYGSNIALLTGRAGLSAAATLWGAVVQCGALIALGLTGRLTVYLVVVVWVLSLAVPLLTLVTAGGFTLRPPDPRTARLTCAKGLKLHAGTAASYALLRSDLFLLNAFSGAHAVGIYSLAVTLAEWGRLAIDTLSQATLARQFADTSQLAAAVTARITRAMVVLVLASGVTIVVVTSVLVTPVYGPAYADVAGIIALLAPGVVVLAGSRPLVAYLLRCRPARFTVVPSLLALVLNVVLNLLLIPVWGAAGCAVASTLAYASLTAVQVALFVRVSGISWRLLLPRTADVAAIRGRLRAVQ